MTNANSFISPDWFAAFGTIGAVVVALNKWVNKCQTNEQMCNKWGQVTTNGGQQMTTNVQMDKWGKWGQGANGVRHQMGSKTNGVSHY